MKVLGKIGIITLNGYFNFGNRLQNYALQEVLKTYDFDVETVWIENIRLHNQGSSGLGKVKRILSNPAIIYRKVNNKLFFNKEKVKREARFKKFSNQYIKETSFKISEQSLPDNILSKYSYFVTGSDQVWNPYFTKASPLYFLTFAPKEKRIAYAPSFGIADIPSDHVQDYKKWLTEMESISVREEAGANIIKELTSRDAQVVADPTLLLSKEDWLSIAKPAVNKPKHDILLTYFLGEIPKDTQERIKKYKVKYGLTVVNLANPKHKEFYLTDPAEFLDYINSAKLFVTDSFHGAVFSILFQTPFIVTDRKGQLPSMNSRIKTLLSTFKLQNRHISDIKEEVLKVDFSYTEQVLQIERDRASKFLKGTLSNDKVI